MGKDAEIRGGLRIPASFCLFWGFYLHGDLILMYLCEDEACCGMTARGTGVLRYIYLVRLESFLFKKYDMYGCN